MHLVDLVECPILNYVKDTCSVVSRAIDYQLIILLRITLLDKCFHIFEIG